jgi:hypothetical protein
VIFASFLCDLCGLSLRPLRLKAFLGGLRSFFRESLPFKVYESSAGLLKGGSFLAQKPWTKPALKSI